MSGSANALMQGSSQLLLRWGDVGSSMPREEFVDVVSKQASKIVVRSASAFTENTQVYLAGTQCAANGVTGSCQKDLSSFIIAIVVDNDSFLQQSPRDRDPGVLAVEQFLTEEQENEILNSLDLGASGSVAVMGGY